MSSVVRILLSLRCGRTGVFVPPPWPPNNASPVCWGATSSSASSSRLRVLPVNDAAAARASKVVGRRSAGNGSNSFSSPVLPTAGPFSSATRSTASGGPGAACAGCSRPCPCGVFVNAGCQLRSLSFHVLDTCGAKRHVRCAAKAVIGTQLAVEVTQASRSARGCLRLRELAAVAQMTRGEARHCAGQGKREHGTHSNTECESRRQ